MKRFVLGTNRTTTEQDSIFLSILLARWPHLGWWHQLGEMWLIVDPLDKLTASKLRNIARQAFPGIHLMVIEAKGPGKWAGFGLKEPPGDMFTWMRDS